MLPLLIAVLVLASGCGGEKETVTVTVTVTETTPAPAPTLPPRLPFPLPEDGTLPVEDFNAYTESVDYPWERSLSALTDAYVEGGAGDTLQRSFRSRPSDEEGTSATATLTLGLLDDSVQSQRYRLELSRREDDTWTIESASWSQRCHEGRGHQDFSPELCL
jgi:hypothetical protein